GAAAVPARLGRRRAAAGPTAGHPALEILSPGPLTLLHDGGRPGRAASGVSRSGAFDRGALLRANLSVGNPAASAALENLGGGLLELGALTEGLRLVLAVRGGLHGTGTDGAVLGSLSRDTLSGLGPAPLETGDVLLVGPERGLDAVPTPVPDDASAAQPPPPE